MTDPADQLLPAGSTFEQGLLRDLQLPRPSSLAFERLEQLLDHRRRDVGREERAAARSTADRVDDLVALGILEDVARGPGHQHLAHGALLLEPGQRHDLERGMLGLQPACGLDAVHLRHADVHQHDVGRQLVHEPDRLDAAGRFADDLEVLAAEQGGERPTEAVVVVHDENPNATGQGKGARGHGGRVRRSTASRYPTDVGFLRGTDVWAGWPRAPSRRATGDDPSAWRAGAARCYPHGRRARPRPDAIGHRAGSRKSRRRATAPERPKRGRRVGPQRREKVRTGCTTSFAARATNAA